MGGSSNNGDRRFWSGSWATEVTTPALEDWLGDTAVRTERWTLSERVKAIAGNTVRDDSAFATTLIMYVRKFLWNVRHGLWLDKAGGAMRPPDGRSMGGYHR